MCDRTQQKAERPLSTENRSNTTKVLLLSIVIYHKTPSAEHLCVILIIAKHYRNRGIDVSTVALFESILADGILETTLARKMMIEEVHMVHRRRVHAGISNASSQGRR